MSEQRLNQVLAVEQSIKSQVEKNKTEAYHLLQRAAAFEGMNRAYRPIDENGEKLPPDNKKVQHQANDVLAGAATKWAELIDVTLSKDLANCSAKADVEVEGTTLLTGVPATFLLFLEKQLNDVHTMLEKMPTLDPAESWKQDVNDGLFKTQTVEKIRTKKIPKVITKHPGNEHHPPQTELIHVDETVGYWDETRLSGAMPEVVRKRLLFRTEMLQAAVKKAREQANMVKAEQERVGASLFTWLFSTGKAG